MAKYNLYVEDVSVEAVFNKLGGVEGAKRFLRDELQLIEPEWGWCYKGGVIRFTVTSDGTTGPEWINRLENQGYRLSKGAKGILRSSDFMSTNGETYKVAVLMGSLFSESTRMTMKIRVGANRRGFVTPKPEVACLIREVLSDEDLEAMSLWWIVTMHEPVLAPDGSSLCLLGVGRDGVGRVLSPRWVNPSSAWNRRGGFAFVLP